jgi:uncharacterized protein (TIGR02118 family)
MPDHHHNTEGQSKALEHLGRRDVVRSAGGALTFGILASAFGAFLPANVRAAGEATRIPCLTIAYPAGPNLKFDADYYRNSHMKLLAKLFGSSIARIELRNAVAGPYAAVVNIWIADLPAFGAANDKHGKELVDDIKNFTNAQALMQFDTVEEEVGVPRDTIKVGTGCLTILYPYSEGVRWDLGYYKAKHMPLLLRLFGDKAVSRYEIRKGEGGLAPGSKPDFVGSVTIYIADQAAFDAANERHGKTLMDDVPNFSSVAPMAFPTAVYAVA